MEKIQFRGSVNDTLSIRSYNVCIGLSLLLGLIITAAATYIFKDNIGMMFYAHPIIFSIMFLVVSVLAGKLSITTENTGVALLGYIVITLATGALLSSFVPYEKVNVLLNAAITTGIILMIMITVASICPSAFINLGHILFTSLCAFIIAEFVMIIFIKNKPAFMDLICIGIFTLYIGYDWSKGMTYPKTAKFAIITATELYLDIVNIFIRLVSRSSSSSKSK